MSTPAPQTFSGLASILSSEPLPQLPMFRTGDSDRIAAEMEQYVRNLHLYLKRLFGRFTATNIITTISQGTGFSSQVSKVIHYVGTDDNVVVILDSSIDWREVGILCHLRIADTIPNLQHFVDDPDAKTAFVPGTNRSGDYPSDIQSAIDSQFFTNLITILEVTSTGVLQIRIGNATGSHQTGYISVFAGAIGSVAGVSSLTAGNGL